MLRVPVDVVDHRALRHGAGFRLAHFELGDQLSPVEWQLIASVVVAAFKDMRLPVVWQGGGTFILQDWEEHVDQAHIEAVAGDLADRLF